MRQLAVNASEILYIIPVNVHKHNHYAVIWSIEEFI